MSHATRAVVFSIVLAAFAAIAAAPASATTFCVPGFHAGCLDNGSNVAKASLETAMGLNSSDGVADTIYFGTSTYTDANVGPGIPGTLEPVGTDDLNVIGAGTDKSFITSAGTSNQFAVNLRASDRKVNMSNLTIRIPAGFPDNQGSALQAEDGVFDHVNIESLNVGSNGADSLVGTTVWKDSHIYGPAGGSIRDGLAPTFVGAPGTLKIIRTTIDDASWAIVANSAEIPVIVERSRINEPRAYGVFVGGGGHLSMENSVIVTGGSEAISATTYANETPADASIRSSTIVAGPNLDGSERAFQIKVSNVSDSGDAHFTVTDSIIRGFASTWDIDAPAGPGLGTASLTLTGSNFSPIGLPVDAPQVDFSDAGNIDQDPLFAGPANYRLTAGSPSIDAAANGPGGPKLDFDGKRRPLDGNGDGIAVRDQGAFEAPDKTAPKITKLKAKTLKRGKVRISFKSSEAARVIYAFKPTPKESHGKKRKAPVLKRKAKRGANVLVVKGGKLSRGRYRIRITATDASGNTSAKSAGARVKGR